MKNKEEIKPLDEKIEIIKVEGYCSCEGYFNEDVKNSIQNLQEELKGEMKNSVEIDDSWEGVEFSIDKLFLKHIGKVGGFEE